MRVSRKVRKSAKGSNLQRGHFARFLPFCPSLPPSLPCSVLSLFPPLFLSGSQFIEVLGTCHLYCSLSLSLSLCRLTSRLDTLGIAGGVADPAPPAKGRKENDREILILRDVRRNSSDCDFDMALEEREDR